MTRVPRARSRVRRTRCPRFAHRRPSRNSRKPVRGRAVSVAARNALARKSGYCQLTHNRRPPTSPSGTRRRRRPKRAAKCAKNVGNIVETDTANKMHVLGSRCGHDLPPHLTQRLALARRRVPSNIDYSLRKEYQFPNNNQTATERIQFRGTVRYEKPAGRFVYRAGAIDAPHAPGREAGRMAVVQQTPLMVGADIICMSLTSCLQRT